jgi:hypothetical protein
MATACVNAGPKWQAAFIRSGLLKGTSIDPVDLGLSRKVHDVWRLSTSLHLRGKRKIPQVAAPRDERLEMVEFEPGYAEREAVRQLLFNDGRFSPDGKRETFTKWKSLEMTGSRRRSSPSRAVVAGMRLHLSYRPDIPDVSIRREFGGFVVKDWAPTTSGGPVLTKEIEGDVYLVSNLWW